MINRRNFLKQSTLTTGAIITGSLATGDKSELPFIRQQANEADSMFAYGVASGDPLTSAVVIWTKISKIVQDSLEVEWCIATNADCKSPIQKGTLFASSENGHVIKIDVKNLQPGTTYYYQFITKTVKSLIGKTKTLPTGDIENLKFAVVSCNNFSAGYFTAFSHIAKKKEINAVIHLGDYIYEGTERIFAPHNPANDDDYESTHFNRTRDWWLHYYRHRYAINRLDPDLQAAHLAHPFITIWDDHEIANNAWKNGAQGHDTERDGEWPERVSAAKQAYAEWMPIRGTADKIYRSLDLGNLATVVMLDSRLEGRDQQLTDPDNSLLLENDRTILGKEQKQWLFDTLDNSTTQWKIIANQVIFSEINVKWASFGGNFTREVRQLETSLLDYWDGYPKERADVLMHISKNKINNVVILSASMHCALAFDVTLRATSRSRKNQPATYDAITGKGSIAVEFAATSISSENFDEKMGKFYAGAFESMINKRLPAPLLYNPNPHLKFADLQRHGYLLLSINKSRTQAEFFFVDHRTSEQTEEVLGAKWHTKSGMNRLEKS